MKVNWLFADLFPNTCNTKWFLTLWCVCHKNLQVYRSTLKHQFLISVSILFLSKNFINSVSANIFFVLLSSYGIITTSFHSSRPHADDECKRRTYRIRIRRKWFHSRSFAGPSDCSTVGVISTHSTESGIFSRLSHQSSPQFHDDERLFVSQSCRSGCR